MKPILILLLFLSSQIALAGSVQSIRSTNGTIVINDRDGSSQSLSGRACLFNFSYSITE